MSAARRWEAALAAWGWPEAIREAAPDDPWRLAPEELERHREADSDEPTPADEAALTGLPRGGRVLDVGCGTGASSARLRDRAGVVVGVDPREEMLEAFRNRAPADDGVLRRLVRSSAEIETVVGRWPDVAEEVGPADVVLAHNVLYDVTSRVDAFVAALHDHARRRVVIALTVRHPLHWVNPYAEAVHGIRRPAEPTAAVAADVVREVTGTTPDYVTWTRPLQPPEDEEELVRLVARRACVRDEQLDDLRDVLERVPPPSTREMAALVWDRDD